MPEKKTQLVEKGGEIIIDGFAPLLQKVPQKEIPAEQKQRPAKELTTEELLKEIEEKIAKKREQLKPSKNLPMVIKQPQDLENEKKFAKKNAEKNETQSGGQSEKKQKEFDSPLKRLLEEKKGKLKNLREGLKDG